ncbi:hypothetical protein FOA52_008890 [Chlamydomonas sp. UWO 241]|nr:hypothetical protein FOA52_008890 [Chlamydomonas sp. UWO 241]
MLDYYAIFSRGGALLWTLQFTAMRHNPLDALNALVRGCLLEERSSDAAFTYTPKSGAAQQLKWTFHNGLGLVFVAVYQKSLSLLYVEELLSLVKEEFVAQYLPSTTDFSSFKQPFDRLLRECEARADKAKRGEPLSKKPQASAATKSNCAAAVAKQPTGAARNSGSGGAPAAAADSDGSGVIGDSDGPSSGGGRAAASASAAGDSAEDDGVSAGAFDVSKFKGALPRGGRGRGGAAAAPPKKSDKKDGDKKDAESRKKADRNWDTIGGMRSRGTKESAEDLDRSDLPAARGGGGHGDGDERTSAAVGVGLSRMDAEDTHFDEEDDDEEVERAAAAAVKQGKPPPSSSGVLSSFLGRLALRVAGSSSLSEEDLAPALEDMKKRLMERNVAEGIAAAVCASVGSSLQGQRLASFTGVGAMVRRAFEEALSGILNKRQVDVLLDIKKSQERGKPYVIIFCGVNGVGKSTNLAKTAYWLGQHGIKVLIAACDTFRAGAVEQLKTHCARLQVR